MAHQIIGEHKAFLSRVQYLTSIDSRVPLYIEQESEHLSTTQKALKSIYGTGMPTVDGFRTALDKMGAGKNGTTWVYWTLMREEPVVFVRGRPVRLCQR